MSKQYTQSRNRVSQARSAAESTAAVAAARPSSSNKSGTEGGPSRGPTRIFGESQRKPGISEQLLSDQCSSFHDIIIAKTTHTASSQLLRGTKVSAWKERVVRVTKPNDTNDGGSIEIFRLNRDKSGAAEVDELLIEVGLKHLDQVAHGYVLEENKMKFLCLDSATQKLVPEYIYGHILLTLTFAEEESSGSTLCVQLMFNNSAKRDDWFRFLSSLVYNKEYVGLVEAPRDVQLFIKIPDCPREAVNRFFTVFTSHKHQEDEVKHTDAPHEEREDKDSQQLQFLAKRFDVILVLDESGTREHVRIECPRPGLICVHGKRDFAVERNGVFQDPVNSDVFYLRPKRSDVVARDLGVQLIDGYLQVIVTSDAREFRQWLTVLFGSVVRKDDINHSEGLQVGERNKSADTASAPSEESYDANRASLLANSVFKSQGVRQRGECTCLVYLQYNSIRQAATPETTFSLCFSILYPLQRRWYFVQKPPAKRILVELHFDDISSITGYSKLSHMAGFTIHADVLGLELHIVPQDSMSRNDWMRTIAECRLRVVKGKTREDWNTSYQNGSQMTVTQSCSLCGENPMRSLFCGFSNLPHAEFSSGLRASPSISYLSFLSRRTVSTIDTDTFLASARESLERGHQANEMLDRIPFLASTF